MQSIESEIKQIQREQLIEKFEKSFIQSSLMKGETIELKDIKELLGAFGLYPEYKKWQIRSSIQLYFKCLKKMNFTSLKNQLKALLVFQLLINDFDVSQIFIQEFQESAYLSSIFCGSPVHCHNISQTQPIQPSTTSSQTTSQNFKQSYFLYLQRISQKYELLAQIKLKVSPVITNDDQAQKFFIDFFTLYNILTPIIKSYKNLNHLLGTLTQYRVLIDDIFIILMNDIHAFYFYISKGIKQILSNYNEEIYSIATLKQFQMILTEFMMFTMHLQTFEHMNKQIKWVNCINIYKDSQKDIQNIQSRIDQIRIQNAGNKKQTEINIKKPSAKKHYPLLSVCFTEEIQLKYQHTKTPTKY